MQIHLLKFHQNYTGTKFEICPFNATHHVPKPEFRHHLDSCPDKCVIESEIVFNQKRMENGNKMLKGCTDTPVYKEICIPLSEDWEAEASAPVRYDDTYMYYDRVQFKDLSGEELEGHRQMAEDMYLRLPKTASKVASTGRGRGRGLTQGITPRGQPAPVNGAAGSLMPTMPYGRGMGMNMGGHPSGAVGVGRGVVAAGGVGRGHVAPPPGFFAL